MNRRVCLVAAWSLSLVLVAATRLAASPAEDEFAQAAHLASVGAVEDSIGHWKQAGTLFEEAQDRPRQVETAIQLASVYYALGQTRLASTTLAEAHSLVS